MSKPTEEQLNSLRELKGDPESYHYEFDRMVEEKLMEFDKEWMEAMEKEYHDSEVARWFA